MKVKVCGISQVDQMQQLQNLGIDYAGIILYEQSKRFAGQKLQNKQQEIRNINIKKIGVFVNADIEVILQAVADYDLYAVQLHGDESTELCKMLKEKITVIKVFRIHQQEEIDKIIAPFQNVCDHFMFDTSPPPDSIATSSYGGTGKKFDWSLLQSAKIGKHFFLSGGIKPADVDNIKAFDHTQLYAVDINSGFEIEPGIKDLTKVELFVKQLNNG
jgi:phosphoribosylanthranilate isomerase